MQIVAVAVEVHRRRESETGRGGCGGERGHIVLIENGPPGGAEWQIAPEVVRDGCAGRRRESLVNDACCVNALALMGQSGSVPVAHLRAAIEDRSPISMLKYVRSAGQRT
ncbi:hypothetical protein GCM10009839_12660 [Catenulispora yoronensis]|uniref:Uncharacterized protein n=1 Tax=Catenulispora yoronensis TaxID=450799 RepID=A0ABN2TSI5_9ACTN